MDDLFGEAQMQAQMMQDPMMQQQMMMQDPMMQQQMMMQNQMYQNNYDMQFQMNQGNFGMQNQMLFNQGFNQQVYQNPYDMQQMYQNPMGSVDRYGNIKYSKQEYLEGLRNYIIRNCGFQVTINKEEKIEDLPQRLRHCCVESKSKIVMLDKLVFNVPETGMSIPFYFCRDCGKLFYYKDFML